MLALCAHVDEYGNVMDWTYMVDEVAAGFALYTYLYKYGNAQDLIYMVDEVAPAFPL